MDPISAIDDLDGLVTTIDGLTTAADSQLDAILLELDQLGHDQVNQAFNDFAGAQPGAEQLLGGGDALLVPVVGSVALLQPNGEASVVLGGPPEAGGVAHAGAAAYTRHLALSPVAGNVQNVAADGGDGPDPPFAQWGPVVQELGPDGRTWWVYHVGINPAHAGTFTGTARYQVHATIAGITGTFHLTRVFQVVVQ